MLFAVLYVGIILHMGQELGSVTMDLSRHAANVVPERAYSLDQYKESAIYAVLGLGCFFLAVALGR